MNNLNINQINIGGQSVTTIDSREVAEMLGKEHSYLLEMIQGREGKLGIIPVLENANLAVSNYFIPSTYRAGTREYKCYLVTKMGCELLGNKQQGEKGILFTAKYVERFNQMEQALREPQKQLTPIEMMELQFKIIKDHNKKFEEVDERLEVLSNSMTIDYGQQEVIQRIAKERLVDVLGGKDISKFFMLQVIRIQLKKIMKQQ